MLVQRFGCFLFSVLVCLAGSAVSQISTIPDSESQTNLGGVNSIVGTVFGPSGRPVHRRVRIVLSTMARGNRSAMTTDNGNFAFRGLPAGSYTIAIEKEPEFKPFVGTVDIIQFRGSPPQTYTMNIRLEFKSEPPPGVVDAALANVPQRAQDLFNSAVELEKKGDLAGAIEQLKLAVAEHPEFMHALNEMGVVYLRMGQLDKADEVLIKAMTVDPEAFPPMMNRGIVLVAMKKYDVAEPILRKIVEAKADSAGAHYFFGQALANLGKFDEGAKHLETAVQMGGPEMKEAHRTLAIIYNSRGDKKRAVAALEKYLQLVPDAKDAEQLRAIITQWKSEKSTKSNP